MIVSPGAIGNQPVIFGCDLGFSDDTVILFFKLSSKGIHLIDEIIINHMNTRDIATLIKNKQYNLRYGIADSSSKKTDMTTALSLIRIYSGY